MIEKDASKQQGVQALVDLLVSANRILARQRIVDGMGHVSVRRPSRSDAFLLSRSLAPAQVRRQDILCYDFDGQELTGSGMRPYLERFIHAELYRAKPHVKAVVHSHSPSVIPFGVTRTALRPVFHMAGFLKDGAAWFDIADEAGETDMLIRNSYLGKLLARSLGDSACVLMRGHGSTVVGDSLEQALYRAVYTEENSKLQLLSCALGDVRFLSPGEAALASDMMDASMGRPIDLWLSELGDFDKGQMSAELLATF
jgi:ribulose-5-phosphate 4-epimerase/fuculose-1-phosphate aldolase